MEEAPLTEDENCVELMVRVITLSTVKATKSNPQAAIGPVLEEWWPRRRGPELVRPLDLRVGAVPNFP